MNNKNLLSGVGYAFLTVGIGVAAYLWYKKEKKALETEKEAIDEELENLGVSGERLREEVTPEDDQNLVKCLYTGIAFNPNWDISTIDIDNCLESPNLIHIGQHEKKNSRKLFQELDILLEIPEYPRNKSFHSPKIADYIRSFKSEADILWERFAKFSDKPFTRLVGYLELSGEIGGEETIRYVEIPSEIYQDYIEKAESHNVGLSMFYEDSFGGKLSKESKEKMSSWISENDIDGEFDNIPKPWVILMYRITFPIQNQFSKYGINFKSALEILHHLTYSGDFSVRKKGDTHSEEVVYENIIFHPSKDDGWYDMSKCYTLDKSNHVCIDEL